MNKVEALDRYLGACVRASLHGETMPAWPVDLSPASQRYGTRLAYHGIAYFLVEKGQGFPNWPEDLFKAAKSEARLQAMWEGSHRRTVATLVEALHEAGIVSIVMKGSALAYSIYDDAATRRRGDTDLLVESVSRNKVRAVFKRCNFEPRGDRQSLQEPWGCETASGFVHEVDLHWKINASMAVAGAYEADHPRQRAVALPRLSENAKAFAPIDSFVQICVNRAAHTRFGYVIDNEKQFEGDRLLWAVDLHLLTAKFSAEDWKTLAQIAANCGAGALVKSGLDFAQRVLGTPAPHPIYRKLEETDPGNEVISSYFTSQTSAQRLQADLRHARKWQQKLSILRKHLFPGRDFLEQKYPGTENWQINVLQMRRVLDAGVKMLLGARR